MSALLTLASALTPACFGWGREGHRLIAEIAERRINAKAKAEIAALLATGETLQSIASWADDIRGDRRETSSWHFINIPVTATRGDYSAFCPATGCVPRVVAEMMGKLKDRTLSRDQRAEALKFLVHFVGDMHQPLHCGDKGDRGGNDVQVVLFDRPTNLHSAWDTPLVDRLVTSTPGKKEQLAKGPGYWSARKMRKGNPDTWVWDAQAISRDVAYANLPAARPAVLGQDYAAKAIPAIEQQILRGGTRLANLLNQAIGQ